MIFMEVSHMPDYKELYYQSQAELADAIELLHDVIRKLTIRMQYCEDRILDGGEEDDDDNIKKS